MRGKDGYFSILLRETRNKRAVCECNLNESGQMKGRHLLLYHPRVTINRHRHRSAEEWQNALHLTIVVEYLFILNVDVRNLRAHRFRAALRTRLIRGRRMTIRHPGIDRFSRLAC